MASECRLQIASGPFAGRMILVDSDHSVSIGRVEPADVRLDHDSSVSRRHATIEYSNGRFRLRDDGSTNGTFLNGTLIASAPLRRGDRIVVGQTLIEVIEATDAPPPVGGSTSPSPGATHLGSMSSGSISPTRATSQPVPLPPPVIARRDDSSDPTRGTIAPRGAVVGDEATRIMPNDRLGGSTRGTMVGAGSGDPGTGSTASGAAARNRPTRDDDATLPIGHVTLDASGWPFRFPFAVGRFGRDAADVARQLRAWGLGCYVRILLPLRDLSAEQLREAERMRTRGGAAAPTDSLLLLDPDDRLDPIELFTRSFGRNRCSAFLCDAPFPTVVQTIADRIPFLVDPAMIRHQAADPERAGLRGPLPGVVGIVVEAPDGVGAWLLHDRTRPLGVELAKLGNPFG
ncbi:MAG TPA: FHA domain-containing protein [Pirellulaceae bacterium]|nr:FHA domain-containing protein [Pirellulaceae bacterium]